MNKQKYMMKLAGILNEDKLSTNDKGKIISLALKVSEKNLASGNWTLKTAKFYNTIAHNQPEDLVYLLKNKKMPKNIKLKIENM